MPLGLLAHAGLVDSYCILYPNGTAYTQHTVHQGVLKSARRLDSIWISTNLSSKVQAVVTTPSLSDHSVVSTSLHTSAEEEDRGPGTWHVHRRAHLEPGYAIRVSRSLQAIPSVINTPADWFAYIKRIRTILFNVSLDYSLQRQRRKGKRTKLLLALASIDISQDGKSQAEFLQVLDAICQLDLSEVRKDSLEEWMSRQGNWLALRR